MTSPQSNTQSVKAHNRHACQRLLNDACERVAKGRPWECRELGPRHLQINAAGKGFKAKFGEVRSYVSADGLTFTVTWEAC